jgi:hypothetical protein
MTTPLTILVLIWGIEFNYPYNKEVSEKIEISIPIDATLTTVSTRIITIGYYEYTIEDPSNSFLNMFREYKVTKKRRRPP